jgi:hypothetical protein
MMNDGVRLTQRPHAGITPEQTRSVRARAWAFVFQCWQEKQKADEPAPEPIDRDGTTVQGDSAHARIIPERT